MQSCVNKSDDLSTDKSLTNMPITLNVIDIILGTRALKKITIVLKMACTPDIGGKAIGIWSAYEVNKRQIKNVLGSLDGDFSDLSIRNRLG